MWSIFYSIHSQQALLCLVGGAGKADCCTEWKLLAEATKTQIRNKILGANNE